MTGAISSAISLLGTQAGGQVGYGLGVVTTHGTVFLPAYRDGVGGRIYVMLPAMTATLGYNMNPDQSVTIDPSRITSVLNTGTALILQANNDITVSNAITANNLLGVEGR